MNLDPFIIVNNENLNDDKILSSENINYTSNQKKKIAERVENLKSKKHFKEIFKIVYSSAPDSYTLDSSGIYINFNLLSNEILNEIENYLNIISPKIEEIPLPTKYTPYFSENFFTKDGGIKLSNHEKNILKYIESESESINQNDSDKKNSESKPKIIIKPFTFE